ncbi:unnamed protein product [Schistosoma mattheei]|uniref:Uncharacterized protein n=1 Tax=Schistosoma mattheei TaxID=31246 RepID=A0A183PAW3_9TREM|nr:unnamed protein product [Schistosoma mattheei]
MVVGHSQQQTLNLGFMPLGTRQQGMPATSRELVFPDGFDPVSSSLTVRNVTTWLSGPRPTSCRTAQIASYRASISSLKITGYRYRSILYDDASCSPVALDMWKLVLL